jgi:hypothetical protein
VKEERKTLRRWRKETKRIIKGSKKGEKMQRSSSTIKMVK